MSRLGDLLHMERMRRKLTAKEVARLTGVSEKYLLEVEAGTRIIQDSQARRMMSKMGVAAPEESAFTLEDIASTVDLQSAVTRARAEAAKPKAADAPAASGGNNPLGDGSIWIDALKGVLQHVPVYNAVMKEVSSRLLPVSNGKIEGAGADKVFYFMAPDNRMRGFRVQQGDLVLVVPCSTAEDGRMMLLDTPLGKQLYVLKLLPRYELLLQTFDQQHESEIVPMADVRVVGRCVRLEAELT